MTRTPVAAILATVAVTLVVIAALMTVGPPSEARERHLDERRQQDLNTIDAAIRTYARRETTLPASLDALSARDLTTVPRDPSTKASYAYTVTGPSTYRLCATFQRAVDERDDPHHVRNVYFNNGTLTTWRHGAGDTCFDQNLMPMPTGTPIPTPR